MDAPCHHPQTCRRCISFRSVVSCVSALSRWECCSSSRCWTFVCCVTSCQPRAADGRRIPEIGKIVVLPTKIMETMNFTNRNEKNQEHPPKYESYTLSIYLSIYLSVCLSIYLSYLILPYPTLPYPILPYPILSIYLILSYLSIYLSDLILSILFYPSIYIYILYIRYGPKYVALPRTKA